MNNTPVFTPSDSTVARVASLSTLPMKELRSLWRELFQAEPPTNGRRYLERRLAYKLQETEFREKHEALLENNERRINALIRAQQQPVRKNPYPQIVPGTVLTRLYQDREYRVTVTVEGQFEFEGRLFKSLSVIAREITGTRWSGPLFFGLRKNICNRKQKRKQQ